MSNLTKRDLVVRISNETGLVQHQVLEVLQRYFDAMIESLIAGRTVELRKFGVFEIKWRKARVGRNPNKPETDIVIPPHPVVKFKPGKILKEKLKEMAAQGPKPEDGGGKGDASQSSEQVAALG
ncbi:MAG: integration host factor subunit beta [Methylacidiphilales bacterium]|nr:integration host factor subunit beta [Candidatus Methylacidiphilales bacterium]MDW8350140.1 HU family DNA-binding protein [Verrucomicrobiae bacterium]